MIIVKEYLQQAKKRDLSSGQVKQLLHDYLFHRVSAQKLSGSAEARMRANALEVKVKKILGALAHIDMAHCYPLRVGEGQVIKNDKTGGKISYHNVADREEYYTYLIEGIENE